MAAKAGSLKTSKVRAPCKAEKTNPEHLKDGFANHKPDAQIAYMEYSDVGEPKRFHFPPPIAVVVAFRGTLRYLQAYQLSRALQSTVAR